nr:MAG TPA: hypothetical protein [Caudoviricetes sp.]
MRKKIINRYFGVLTTLSVIVNFALAKSVVY